MLPDYQVKVMLRTARKKAKETGKTIDDILMDIIYDTDNSRERLLAIKLFKEFTMSKTSEQNINVNKKEGPVIGLPPMREDPALKIVKG